MSIEGGAAAWRGFVGGEHSAVAVGQRMIVVLRNPWGNGEPGADGKDDGVFEMPLADFQRNYGVYISTTGKP